MGFFIAFFVSLLFTVVGELLRPKQKFEDPTPSALGDFTFPTADATRIIGAFWGTCKLEGPNVTWFGDLRTEKISKKVKTGWFSSTNVTQGHKYYIGVQLVFSLGPVDELLEFQVDRNNILTSKTDNGDYWSFTMNAPTLLGDEDPKNGVTGPVKIYKGTTTQPANAYLQQKWGEVQTSGFRRCFYAVLEHCYMGNSDTPPQVGVVARRCPNPLGLTGGAHNINGDANFANMAYEVMTEGVWGLRIPAADIDIDSFIEAGNTLAAEGLGGSMVVNSPMTGRALLSEFMRHVDGTIFADPQTGKYTMKLARDDYDVNTIPEFDDDNIVPNSFEFSRVSWDETKNTSIINYTDREAGFLVKPVQYQDPANVFVRGGLIDSETIDFLGLSNKTAANKIAARVNKTRSSPLARMQFRTNRDGYVLRPGSVIKVSKPGYGIVGIIMRVVDVSYGTADNPEVTVICTEDIFAVNAFAFVPPEDTGWVPIWTATVPLRHQRLEEVPYEMIDQESRFVMALGVRDDFVTEGFEVWTAEVSEDYYKQTAEALGTLAGGTLRSSYSKNTAGIDVTGFVIENVVDPTLLRSISDAELWQGRNLLLINDEWMAWRDVTFNGDGSVTLSQVVRAVFDTVPQTHAAGSVVYIPNETLVLTDGLPYAEDLTLLAKFPTKGGGTTMSMADVLPLTVTTQSRAMRPNPPGAFRINGLREYQVTGASGEVEISWEPRNKTLPGLVSQDQIIAGQPGVTTKIEIHDNDTNTLLLWADGVYEAPAQFALSTSRNVRVSLSSEDFDGQSSLRKQVAVFPYTSTGGSNYLNVIRQLEFDESGAVILSIVGGAITIDCRYDHFVLKLTENVTSVSFINIPPTKIILIQIEQMSPGSHTIDFGTSVAPVSGVAYVPTATVGATDLVGLVTLNQGVLWQLKVSQAGEGGGDLPPLVVNISPSPASGTSDTDGITPTSPSVQVTATVEGAEGNPVTFLWEYAGTGATQFQISNAAVADPTISREAGTTAYGPRTEPWRVTANETTNGRIAQKSVNVTLERTYTPPPPAVAISDQNIAGLTVSPNPAYAGYELNANGIAYRDSTGSGKTAISGEWLSSGAASDYEVMFDQRQLVGDPLNSDSGTYGTWMNLGTTRSVYAEVGGSGHKVATLTFRAQIRRVSDGVVLDTAMIELYMESSL